MLRCPMCGHLFSENQSSMANEGSYVVTLDLNRICPGCRGEISRIRAAQIQKNECPSVEKRRAPLTALDTIQFHHENKRMFRRSLLLERDSDEIHGL